VVIFTKLGQSADALALFQKAYALFEGQGNKYWMAAVLGDMGSLIGGRPNTPDTTTAVDYLTRALSLIDPEVYRTDADAIYHNLGVMHYSLKNYAQAKQYFQKGLALARELQFPTAVALFNYRLGIIAKNEGRLDEALGYFDQALPALAKNDGRFVFWLIFPERRCFRCRSAGQRAASSIKRTNSLGTHGLSRYGGTYGSRRRSMRASASTRKRIGKRVCCVRRTGVMARRAMRGWARS
jgi:tetratricopeptide (TPR) repeat protein